MWSKFGVLQSRNVAKSLALNGRNGLRNWEEVKVMTIRDAAANPFETDLDRNAANYAPLTPLGLIQRSAAVYPNYRSVVHGERR